MGKPSLLHQFKHAIDDNFKPGVDKHSYRKLKNGKTRIFSYGTRRCYIKFCGNLTNYLKANFNDVRYLKNITPSHMESFFMSKKEKCGPHTLYEYMSYLRTLEKLIKQTYKFNVNLTKGYDIGKLPKKSKNKKRNISMKQEDLNKLLMMKKNSNSPAIIGVRLADVFGLRVSEICSLKGKDIDLEKGILHIHESKGKRSRDIPIDSLLKIQLCNEIKSKTNDNDRVCPLREDSVNKFLSRNLISLNITRYKDGKTGIHSIRKKVAKEVIKENKKNGLTKQQAIDATSKFLGHNKNRNFVINTYIKSK